MTKKPEIIPVVFRKDRGKNPEITAVFPTLTERPGMMTCYAHVGQHGTCSLQWYWSTRRATPEEYADLLAELRDIYERSHFPGDPVYTLKVYQRITPQIRKMRQAEDKAFNGRLVIGPGSLPGGSVRSAHA